MIEQLVVETVLLSPTVFARFEILTCSYQSRDEDCKLTSFHEVRWKQD